MKKFNAEGPEYGLFDLAAPEQKLGMAYETADNVHPLRPGVVWEPEPAVDATNRSGIYRGGVKRMIDVILVLASAPFVLPVVLLCALALMIESGKPFYRQDRLGLRRRTFSILKLRTMVPNADQVLESILAKDPAMRLEWDSLQKLKKDPRITRVGQILRATSLDELPQLWNVLKGDMSLVGPRPMMPDQAPLYGDMRSYDSVRPGLTGLWQVSERNGSTFAFRNEVDAEYERTLGLRGDVTIIFKTVGVVLRGTGY